MIGFKKHFYLGFMYSFLAVVLFLHSDPVVHVVVSIGTYLSLYLERGLRLFEIKRTADENERYQKLSEKVQALNNRISLGKI